MLSIKKIRAESVLRGHYLGVGIDDPNEPKRLSEWMGKGAERQGLVGDMCRDRCFNVIGGNLPSGEMLGRRSGDGDLFGRDAYELTFSLNKDINRIIFCSKDKKLREYFLNEHQFAVKAALREVEDMVCAKVIEFGNTSYEPTKNMIAALCTHFVSRAGDPQIHTHAIIADATQRQDGQWRHLAADSESCNVFFELINRKCSYLCCIYNMHMAGSARLRGFRTMGDGKHLAFSIDGISRDYTDPFLAR